MINELGKRNKRRSRRTMSVRKHLRGSSEKPRLSVFKSNKHLFAQLIDDEKGITLASAGTVTKEFRGKKIAGRSKEAAREIGKALAEAAKKSNIQRFVFDRGYYKYHGLLAEIADSARELGLQF
ncbi:MAG: 50S ribosomal protein L18 [Verrucomicrobia bacterium]|nr:50S ribosomal protein L18 [Verrucomicrobiota bacterium]